MHKPIQETMLKKISAMTQEINPEDYAMYIGALNSSLSHILVDPDLVPGCWMDILKDKIETAVLDSIKIAAEYGDISRKARS